MDFVHEDDRKLVKTKKDICKNFTYESQFRFGYDNHYIKA